MAEITDLDVTDASNTARWPEGMAPSAVNNAARADEGMLARGLRDTIIPTKTTGGSADVQTLTPNQTVTAYAAGLSSFTFKAGFTNTGACTLNVSALGAKSIKLTNGSNPHAGAITAGGYYSVIYDGTNFILLNPNMNAGGTLTGTLTMSGAAINEAEGSAIASATTIGLDAATGNFVHITGTTAITTVTLAQGAERVAVFDGALTFTHGSGLILPGGASITTAAGDIAVLRGEGSSVTRCTSYTKANGNPISLQAATTSVVGGVIKATQAQSNAGTADKFPSAAEIKANRFISTGFAISTTTAVAVTHGLGVVPAEAGYYVECLSVDKSFAVGDRIHGSTLDSTTGSEPGNVWSNATEVGIRLNVAIRAFDKGGTTNSALDTSKWNCHLWARAV